MVGDAILPLFFYYVCSMSVKRAKIPAKWGDDWNPLKFREK